MKIIFQYALLSEVLSNYLEVKIKVNRLYIESILVSL